MTAIILPSKPTQFEAGEVDFIVNDACIKLTRDESNQMLCLKLLVTDINGKQMTMYENNIPLHEMLRHDG